MSYPDDQVADLRTFMPPLTRKPDFFTFWEKTIARAKAVPLNAERITVPYPIGSITVCDIQYCGFDTTPIHGWLIFPDKPDAVRRRTTSGCRYPCLIHYHGFNGSRGLPCDHTVWTSMGMAVLSIDCRDQTGSTGNHAATYGGSTQSVVCRGILDKDNYYFRHVYMDCLKAIDFATAQPEIDPSRIVIEGGSQGGALGMAVCSLDERPWIAMVDVPSNSLLEERVINAWGSFSSVTEYLRLHPHLTDQAFDTLSYFDTMNMAERIRCPLLASVGGNDQTCPARCYFASYNRMTSPKEIYYYPFNGHEGGRNHHLEKKLAFLARHLENRPGMVS
jgi:cephalosporin-C deacetylase